jgi:hypothetical protein
MPKSSDSQSNARIETLALVFRIWRDRTQQQRVADLAVVGRSMANNRMDLPNTIANIRSGMVEPTDARVIDQLFERQLITKTEDVQYLVGLFPASSEVIFQHTRISGHFATRQHAEELLRIFHSRSELFERIFRF